MGFEICPFQKCPTPLICQNGKECFATMANPKIYDGTNQERNRFFHGEPPKVGKK